MLVLSRQVNERIIIGSGKDAIVISVVDLRGSAADGSAKVRLGITAPSDVPVHRLEVYEQIAALAAKQEGR